MQYTSCMIKKDTRTLSADTQEALRIRVAQAVLDGMKQRKAAKAFGVTEVAISHWMKVCREQGMHGLKNRKRGPKNSPAILKGYQAAIICNIIRDRHPEQLKLAFALWTSAAIRELIAKRFKIVLSKRSVRRYLQRWNYTPQKPKRIAYEKDQAEVDRWKSRRYPAIRALAKKEKARIYWADEMGLRSDHQAGRSYSPIGVTPTRRGTGLRFGCNMISAITNRGDLSFLVYHGKFVSDVFIDFMGRLIKESRGRKIFLIVDGHPVHRSKKVRDWVKENESKIRLYFLPPYSPELNPDECVNHDVKQNAVGRRNARNANELMHNVISFLVMRQQDPKQVKRYFHEADVQYAAS